MKPVQKIRRVIGRVIDLNFGKLMLILRNIVRAGAVRDRVVERHRRAGFRLHGSITVADADPQPVVRRLLSVKQNLLIFPVLNKFPHQNRTG